MHAELSAFGLGNAVYIKARQSGKCNYGRHFTLPFGLIQFIVVLGGLEFVLECLLYAECKIFAKILNKCYILIVQRNFVKYIHICDIYWVKFSVSQIFLLDIISCVSIRRFPIFNIRIVAFIAYSHIYEIGNCVHNKWNGKHANSSLVWASEIEYSIFSWHWHEQIVPIISWIIYYLLKQIYSNKPKHIRKYVNQNSISCSMSQTIIDPQIISAD